MRSHSHRQRQRQPTTTRRPTASRCPPRAALTKPTHRPTAHPCRSRDPSTRLFSSSPTSSSTPSSDNLPHNSHNSGSIPISVSPRFSKTVSSSATASHRSSLSSQRKSGVSAVRSSVQPSSLPSPNVPADVPLAPNDTAPNDVGIIMDTSIRQAASALAEGSVTIVPDSFYIAHVDKPDEATITLASQHDNTTTPSANKRARQDILRYFRSVSRGTKLTQKSVDVPYLTPIGETNAEHYPIPDYLMHVLYHMSGSTLANLGFGVASPQLGVNYRMLVLRSELFGHPSGITNIPYILPTTPDTNCQVSPQHIQQQFPRPTLFDDVALSWDNPNPRLDMASRPPVNISKSGLDWSSFHGIDNNYLATRETVPYTLEKQLTMPVRDAAQLAWCDDSLLVEVNQETGKKRLYPSKSFLNVYRGYSLPLHDIERHLFGPLIQSLQQQIPTTAFINPRICDIRHEYWSLREGCFSFPNWAGFVTRPIACDIEYETLEVDTAVVPQIGHRSCQDSALLSASLVVPALSPQHRCPTIQNSGLNLEHIELNMVKQLEMTRPLPRPEQVRLVTRRVTVRDLLAKIFLHEFDHLDGINFVERTHSEALSWQPPFRDRTKKTPEISFAYPVILGKAYF